MQLWRVTKRYLQTGHKGLTWYNELKNIRSILLVGYLWDYTAADEQLEKVYETWSDGLLSIPVLLSWQQVCSCSSCAGATSSQIDAMIDQRQQQPPMNRMFWVFCCRQKMKQEMRSAEQTSKITLLGMLVAGHRNLNISTNLCACCWLNIQQC